MSVRLRDTQNTLRQASSIRVRDSGNVLRSLSRITMRDANNVLRTVWRAGNAFTLRASPASLSRTASGSTARTLATGSTTVTVEAGGTAPFTYAWTQVDGDEIINASNPSAATSAFQAAMAPNDILSGTFRCTVTDSLGRQSSVDVPVYLHLVDTGGFQ